MSNRLTNRVLSVIARVAPVALSLFVFIIFFLSVSLSRGVIMKESLIRTLSGVSGLLRSAYNDVDGRYSSVLLDCPTILQCKITTLF